MGFQGGGREREQLWRQTATERQLKTRLKEFFTAAKERRRRESGRRGGGERVVEESEFGSDRSEGGGDVFLLV